LYGAFVWARWALKHQKRRFPARAVEFYGDEAAKTEGKHWPPTKYGDWVPAPFPPGAHYASLFTSATI
jgi:hypothetical protein